MKCEKDFDGRTLTGEQKESLRISAVRRVIEDQESPEDVIDSLGMNRRTIYRWLESYHYGGWEALKNQSKSGRPPKLTAKQMEWLAKTLREKNPIQLNFEFALWTLSMIRQVIRDRFDVRLSEVSVGRLMKTLGFTPQRPIYKAWQQDKALADEWQAKTYRRLKARAKREKADIFFCDESSIRTDYHAGTTWSEKGKTPIVKATGGRHSCNMVSAISPRGKLRFMTVNGSMNATRFCEFLDRLMQGQQRKIFLVVDQHPSHKANKVKSHIEKFKGRLELHFLPPYSPELNPDELVWGYLKKTIARHVVQTKEELRNKVISILKSLQKRKSILKNFFRETHCAYTIS